MDEPFAVYSPASLKLYTVNEVADLLQVSRRTVSSLDSAGRPASHPPGSLGRRILRVRHVDLEAFIDQYATGGGGTDLPAQADAV